MPQPGARILALGLASLVLTASRSGAQTAIRADAVRHQWYLTAGESTYVLGLNEQQAPQTLYWGPSLPPDARLPQAHTEPERASFDSPINTTALEYPAWGQGLFTEPALKLDSPNGDRSLILTYDSSVITGTTLELTLRDTVQPIRVHLFYQLYPQGVLARWSRLENLGTKPFQVEQIASAIWNLPAGPDYSLSWLTGQWGAEWQLHTAPIQAGSLVLESRRGSTGHQANPWFAIGDQHTTTEESGPVWFGELGWSGSWRMTVENTALHHVRVSAGLNPFDFSYTLKPGDTLDIVMNQPTR